MEYSVGQLVKKILKQWYVIIVVAGLFAGSGVLLSHLSYERAVNDYNQNISETFPVSTGIVKARYTYNVRESVLELMQEVASDIQNQDELETDYKDTLETLANTYLKNSVIKEKVQEVLFGGIQQDLALGNDFTSFVQLDYLGDNSFDVTIRGQEENVANAIFEKLAEILNEDHLFQVTYTKNEFVYDDPTYTDHALFSQVIMQEPAKKPNFIKTGGTAAVFGFALACIGVLLVQFVQDSKEQEVCDKESHNTDNG